MTQPVSVTGGCTTFAVMPSGALTAIDTRTGALLGVINLLQNYDPISGAITGPVGGLPIQTPASPDGKYMVTANTLTATITITDTATDRLVAMVSGDAGTHGVQFRTSSRRRNAIPLHSRRIVTRARPSPRPSTRRLTSVPPRTENEHVLRAVLAALFLVAGLTAGSAPITTAAPAPGDAHPRTRACAAHAGQTDAGGEWHARPDPAAPTVESTGRWRSVLAVLAGAGAIDAVAAIPAEPPARPRAPSTPPHLRHTPLLI